jgi:hypothetical protein
MAVRKNSGATSNGAVQTNAGVMPSRASDITITAWFKPVANSSMFVGLSDGSSYGTFFGSTAGGALGSIANAGSEVSFGTAVNYSGVWQFVAFVFTESNDTWTAYLGDESTAVSGSAGTRDMTAVTNQGLPPSNGRFVFGAAPGGFGSITTNVECAYVRCWNSALNVSEIEAERLTKSAVKTGVWIEIDANAASDAQLITDQSANARTLSYYSTGSAADWTTSTDPSGLSEPSGASAALPRPFGSRGTVFNGGRAFLGNLG